MTETKFKMTFSKEEFLEIKNLVCQLEKTDSDQQKSIRQNIRNIGLSWRKVQKKAKEMLGLKKLPYTVANLEKMFAQSILKLDNGDKVLSDKTTSELIGNPSPNIKDYKDKNLNKFDEIESLLMDEKKYAKVCKLTKNEIPDKPGLYAIRIISNTLPEEFVKILKQRKHNILYIGISKDDLRQRLWCEELHHKNPATFFRSMGAILGYRPPINSLSLKSRNYKFSPEDTNSIIKWMEDNLIVNYICLNEKPLKDIEKGLIKKYIPLVNIMHNPFKSKELKKLRNLCVNIARSK